MPHRREYWYPGEHIVEDVEPTTCVNCEAPCGPQLYCSERCQQTAEIIRYTRRSRRDGRGDLDPGVEEAIQIRVALILGGGYPHRERRLTPDIRHEVFERDGRLCQKCGATGAEVDHIESNSPALDNLQLLCRACHVAKTRANMEPIDPEDTDTMAMADAIRRRMGATLPERICDDDESWPQVWSGLLKQARDLHTRGDGVPDPDDLYSFGEDPGDQSPEAREYADYFADLMSRDD